jgi:outer membrane receptor for ferrienterochelin and colicins
MKGKLVLVARIAGPVFLSVALASVVRAAHAAPPEPAQPSAAPPASASPSAAAPPAAAPPAAAPPASASPSAAAPPAAAPTTQVSAAAAAKPAPAPVAGTDPKQVVDVVVTGTRTRENARRSPVRVDVVTRAEAERRGATNVGEALLVNPSAYGAIGRPSAVQIGGLDGARVLVLEDGERVVGDTGGAIDLAQIPLADVARIETVTGPASALYGSSALGGVVNVITAPPEIEGPSGNARAEWRSPAGALLFGSAAYRTGQHWAQADGSFTRGEGVALDPALPDLAAPGFIRGFAGLRAGTQIAPGSQIAARIRFSRDREDGLETQLVPGLGRYVIDLPETSDRFSVRVRETLAIPGGHELTVSLAKQWFWNTSGRDRRDSPIDELRTRSHTMHSAEATASLFTDRSWSVLAGARFEAESFVQKLRRTEVIGGGLQMSELQEVPDTSLASGALYGQLKAKLSDAWTALAGARLEGSSRYGVAVAPSTGVAFSPSDRFTLRLHGGRGYRAPSAKELGFVFDHSVYGYRVVGNPDLAPETSWGIGADADVTPARGVRLRASVFANWVQDLIDFQLAPSGGGPAGVDTYTYTNVGSARTMGVSLDASIRATAWLRTQVGWDYVFTRDETLQRPLPGRPPHTVHASAYANLPFGIDAVVRASFVTEAFVEDIEPELGSDTIDSSLRAPGFGIVDARLSKAIYGHIAVYCGVLNLLDARKDPHRHGDARPVEGRTFYAGASADFPWEQ